MIPDSPRAVSIVERPTRPARRKTLSMCELIRLTDGLIFWILVGGGAYRTYRDLFLRIPVLDRTANSHTRALGSPLTSERGNSRPGVTTSPRQPSRPLPHCAERLPGFPPRQ